MGRFKGIKIQNNLWQLYAVVYDAVMLRLLPYRRLMAEVRSALRPRAEWRILDAGCGTGNFLHDLVQSCPGVKAAGVDFSPAMLNRARLKAGKAAANRGELLFEEADLNAGLPFSDEEFEGVICVNVLYAVKEPAFLLAEIYRVLRKSGRLILVSPPFQPRMGPVFKEHVCLLKKSAPRWWFVGLAGQILALLPYVAIFLLINCFIKGRQSFHFFKAEELFSLVKSCGLEVTSLKSVYGGQDWLLEAVKPAASSA